MAIGYIAKRPRHSRPVTLVVSGCLRACFIVAGQARQIIASVSRPAVVTRRISRA